ncbi:hypothetical protein [Rhodoluna lacicola]|jgi:uncharacterized protein YdhG (YjbR/CyaY superfamily)|uniref:YdhG-like domain-containing protein n=1 Tax=Rhodoluna lacicola TaxID=529884 RepID=A0A060JLG6_9MICO|nr:hypothetical protein [Rhodoluna lacicola]AIC47094.1 protein of unknown function (DU1801) [Rhodoluna lacicola]
MAMTDAEKQALKETMAERAKARKKMTPEQHEADVVEKINAMAAADKAIAKKIHALVKKIAPGLQAKTWYGMQAYCDNEGKTVLFFQDAGKFKARYSTLGFQDAANLDKDQMWATSFAVIGWNADVEKKISALIKKAIS